MAHLGALLTPGSKLRPIRVLLLAFLATLVWSSSASAAVTRNQAATRAVNALGSKNGNAAVIVFGLTKPLKAGTKITQAGTTKPSNGSTSGLSSKLRSAGVRTVKAPSVLTASNRSYFFYEDSGPYQLYQHPGRVALVEVATGKVTLSKTIAWPPLINNRLPAFLKSAGAYRSSKYKVFDRPWTVPGATQQRIQPRNQFDNDPFGPGKPLPSLTNSKTIANRLAAENSCILRVTDTLPAFWNAQQLNLTRSYVGTLFEQLERDNPAFVDDRYGARSGETLGESVDRLAKAGCKDILLYIAGQGYSSAGEPVIHLGTSVLKGGLIAQQNLSATDLRSLVSSRPGITFKFKIDAPYAGGMIDRLKDLTNVLLVETPSATGDEAFAFVPNVDNGSGQQVASTSNPAGLLEFTNCELMGLKAFFDSASEIDKATQGQNEGVSFLAEMLARAQELCNGNGGFADDLGASPQLYAAKRASGNGTNRPPKADKQDVAVTEDTPKNITLTGSDPDGDSLTFTITKNPDHGTLSGSGANVTYTPDLNYIGPDDFSFKVDDGKGLSNTAKVDITVSAANDAPVVTTSAGNTSFTEDGAAVTVDSALTVTDVDDTQLEGATVKIRSTDFQSGDDLIFVNQLGITGVYNSGTGVLTLTGTASKSDYQTALRSITFDSTSQNPDTTKAIDFTANDGSVDSAVATKNIAVSSVNDAPVLNTTASTLAYSENSAAVAVDPGITASDVDSANLTGATVQISSNFSSAEDSLAFVNQNGISGSYNSGTGVLTLTGSSSVANYQTALRSVQYQNSADNPSTATRTVSFQVNDGGAVNNLSNVATRDISVSPANDAPVVTTTAGSTAYSEGAAGVQVDGGLTVTDADDTNIESAQVRISANFESGDDLIFVNQSGISGVYNTGTGVLTMTGTASKSDYQAALRSITYRNTTDDNLATPKTVEFKVNDGDVDSNLATKDIAITGVNDHPVLNTTGSTLSYTEGDGAVAVDPGITASDVDSANLTGATVQITGNFSSAEDSLAFVNTPQITGVYNSGTGTLTLSGTTSVANYQAALRAVTYQNSSDNPSTATRTVSFQADDGGAVDNLSNVATRNISVAPANDAPVVTTSAGSTAYTEGGAAATVDGSLTVTDADDTNIEGGQVRISSGFQSGDDLVFVNQNGISGVYNTGTGVLTLSGTSSVANYQTALRSITFQTTNDNPTGKTVEFKVNDGDLDSGTAIKTINITGQNDGPTITTTASTLAYTEGDGAVPADTGLLLSDPENDQISGATVQITGNFSSAEDSLAFVNTPQITGVYNSGTGTLTLSGTTSVANYQAALRAVTYQNSSDNPSTATRTVSFQATDAGTPNQASNVATRNISVARANDAPVVTTSAGDTSYTEGGAAATVDGSLTVTDADDTNIEGGQVRISSGFQSGDDLVFVNQNGISGVYNTGTGVLTLSGTSSVANYQTALRSILYQTTNDNPSTPKTVEFKVNDGDVDSNLATKNIAITGANDAPTLTTSGGNATFTEDTTGPVAVDPNLTLTDPDSTNISGATVELTTNFDSSEDQLQFVNTASITGVYNSGTGVLTLSGSDTVANYQAALRSVTYNNTDTVAPNTATRTVRFQATDSGSAASNQATRNVTVNSVNDAPVVTTTAGSTPYTEDAAATTIDSGVTVTDQDDTNIEGGQVRISSGFQSGDDLVFVNQNGISGVYNTGTGVLTLSGTSSVANYQTALQSIQFQSTNQQPVTSKTVEFKVNDGDVDSNLATKQIAVTPTNDGPIVTAGGTLSYTENDPATAVHSGLTIDDLENDNITGGSASITANYQAGQDFLNWTDNNLADNITLDNINSSQQTIVLTGIDTEANYQAALRAVTYQNTSENPSTLNRTVTFSATDQPGLTGSATRTISVTAVDDLPTAVNDSATVLEDAAATSIPVLTNDTDVDGGPKTISSASDPANGTVVLTGGSPGAHTGLTYQPDPNYCNDPPATTPDTFTYTVNGGSSATVSMTVTCVNDAPVADDETFNGNDSAHGNTTMVVNDPDDAAPNPSRPKTTVSGDILAGDTDVDGPGPLTVTPGTFATNDGGSVTIEADGDFTFEPAPSTSCTDTSDFFDYTVEDSGSPEQTDTGRVTIAIAGCVWYVSNNAAGNSGTSAAPFDTLAQAETASGNNHTVFVFDGDNTSTGYNTGYAMNSGERLIGEHEGLVVDPDGGGALTPDTLHPANPGAHPTLTATNEDVVELDDGNEVRGFTLDPTGTGGGIAGATGDTGGGTIDDINVLDTGVAGQQPGIELDGTTGTFNFSNIVVNNTAATSPPNTATGVRLNNAGTANFDATGQTSITTSGAKGLDVTSTNMGAGSTFDDITVSGSGVGGVSLSSASGTTTFGDGTGTDLSLTTTSGASPAFGVANSGTVSVAAAGSDDVHATGGPAVDVTGTSGPTLAFDDVDSTSSANDGINLDGLGTGTFSATSGDVTGASGISFDLNGGSGAITYPGNFGNGTGTTAFDITGRSGGVVSLSGPLSDTNDAGGGVNVSSNTGGSTVFSGATKQFNTGASDAVDFTSSDGHTLVFSGGGSDIDVSSGNGVEATTSGTLQVSGSGNTLDKTSGAGRGLNISDTDIAAANVTFQRIAVDGAVNGVRLNNTGSSGGLTVTGTGSAGTGGTIQNTTADGMLLNTTINTSLDRMIINDAADSGISADAMTNLDIANSQLNRNGAQPEGGAVQDAGIHLEDLVGAGSTITSTDVLQSRNTGLDWDPNSSAAMSTLTVTGSKFNQAGHADGGPSVAGNSGVSVQATGTANVKLALSNSETNDNPSFGVQTGAGSGTTVRTDIDNIDVMDNVGGNDSNGGVIHTVTGGSGQGIHRLANSDFNDIGLNNASTIGLFVNSTGQMDATIDNNNISTPAGAVRSGAATQFGLSGEFDADSDSEVNIVNNDIYHTAFEGMLLTANDFAAGTNPADSVNLDLNIHNNTVGMPDDVAVDPLIDINGIEVQGRHDNDVCLDITGNSAEGRGSDPFFASDILVWKRNLAAIFRIERLTPAAATAAQAATHVNNENPADEVSADTTGGGTFTGVADGTCQTPTLP